MAQSKNLSKSKSRNKLIESTDSDHDSSCATTKDKSVQSTNASNIVTTNNETADNKSESLSNGKLKLLSWLMHSSFIDVM